MSKKLSIIACLLLAFIPEIAAAGVYPVCRGYQIDSPNRIRFNANEKKLICGDPDAASWQDIPEFQAEYFIRTFLQQRGYFFPEFRKANGVITIVPGEKTRVTRVEVTGSPPRSFKLWKRRQIRQAVLTPANLDILEGWARANLKAHSYACPVVTAKADAADGSVTLNVEPGDRKRILSVDEEPVKGLRPGILSRYNAFKIGDPYKSLNIALTAERIVSDGILQTSYFLTNCTPEGVALTQKNVAGARNLVSVAFGGSTEEYIIGKAAWKMARLGKNGASFQVAGRASYRRQRLYIDGSVYPLPRPSRFFIWPSFSTKREYEKQYEYLATDVWIAPAYRGDTSYLQYTVGFGPKLDYTHTFKGAARGWTHFLSAAAGFKLMTHDFEYYGADPRSGYSLDAYTEFNSDRIYSSVTAQNIRTNWHAIWNIGGFEPPLLVVGMRGMAGTTITDFDSPKFSSLPPHFLFYLGGTSNLRGFGRMELQSNGHGALSALYTGFEARLANILPLNLQPFAFADIGAVGARSLNLDKPVYWSPGFGIRWPSLVGVMRFTVGHGYLIDNDNPANEAVSHWQFIFSIGEEF